MYIISNTTIYDPPLLSQYIQKHKITQILFTPSLLEAVLNTPGLDLQQLASLRYQTNVFNQSGFETFILIGLTCGLYLLMKWNVTLHGNVPYMVLDRIPDFGVSDCCWMPSKQFFQLYHGENKLHYNEDDDDIRVVLDQHD